MFLPCGYDTCYTCSKYGFVNPPKGEDVVCENFYSFIPPMEGGDYDDHEFLVNPPSPAKVDFYLEDDVTETTSSAETKTYTEMTSPNAVPSTSVASTAADDIDTILDDLPEVFLPSTAAAVQLPEDDSFDDELPTPETQPPSTSPSMQNLQAELDMLALEVDRIVASGKAPSSPLSAAAAPVSTDDDNNGYSPALAPDLPLPRARPIPRRSFFGSYPTLMGPVRRPDSLVIRNRSARRRIDF
ncbi:hypothetical protein [Alphabaculovirus myunipunctae]|uniref:Uncharacterized protein n=1 Tax=Mythimna unipuncta nucleopolyhedrovirus TaxID=447897 RepID=A0A2K9VS26_9ABAC|nr:hypothetical protein [Mythimna unipuncta nucleopolyhedrovirus]AUV65265.1 hypothetical protein [Mythimna unipuncta nucleopolyhedrovirus]